MSLTVSLSLSLRIGAISFSLSRSHCRSPFELVPSLRRADSRSASTPQVRSLAAFAGDLPDGVDLVVLEQVGGVEDRYTELTDLKISCKCKRGPGPVEQDLAILAQLGGEVLTWVDKRTQGTHLGLPRPYRDGGTI